MILCDERFMARAIQLARQAEPQSVSPNPHVGAVLVYDEDPNDVRIIGEGYHKKRGEGHAEVECLRSVRDEDKFLIQHATMYVTLEPCAHVGRTPSCASMLVERGVPRVVVGTTDPNPLVAGKGIDILRSNGIQVLVGCLSLECREVARVFMTNQERHRPFITLKWAQSQDGYMDRQRTEGSPIIFSSPFSAMLVHRERSRHSAILVGARTILLDRARLSNRLWTGNNPAPFVLDPRGESFDVLATYDDAKRWTVVTTKATMDAVDHHTFKVLAVDREEEMLDGLMTHLMKDEKTSLLVEGGSYTLSSFISAGLWDEARIEKAPFDLFEEGIKAPDLSSARKVDSHTIDGRVIDLYRRFSER
ncbi:Riboflavin biosynthesis protein RibD [Porphyromonas cangingivalis]|uniref:Riboflavin biosynthesis protein RibD n=2 Tax=Porphyromonas cangingivalis TaxID=36874 RepID=A0A1T4MDD1_PORCN|nr:diaminohydroxyphosphoribosylaminopyrimidine deaminase [Porphyromonas cangingivalis]VEJ03087.1 Riboflavin biosynthesis protein RibD [Porphyromonas cangingivalis]